MGCLNSNGNFNHWFGNIHLSGPCNRACYFCIGQHMMALDTLNNLNKWPLQNIDIFVDECLEKGISEINVTGSNTDPLLYEHMNELYEYLKARIPNLKFGLRTNGVLLESRVDRWEMFDKLSISITSLDPELYKRTMGMGTPPNVERILKLVGDRPLKINVVMCPETVSSGDIFATIENLAKMGVKTINLREPYGQPHIGNPFPANMPYEPLLGMKSYLVGGARVTYWDVHYVEVESVNLYANGNVSTTYPVSKGHCPKTGVVKDQSKFAKSGRATIQWKNRIHTKVMEHQLNS